MPYSIDPEENKKNPFTPSSMGMESQLVYKIASLESTITNSLRRLDEKFDRLLSEVHDRHVEVNQHIIRLESETKARFELKRSRIDSMEKDLAKQSDHIKDEFERRMDAVTKELCKDIAELKQWRTVVVTRMGMVGVGAFAVWAIIGQPIQDLAGRVLGTG